MKNTVDRVSPDTRTHTGRVTTEGITVYDGGKPYKAILWGGAGYRGGLADAEESVQSANKVARIQGVQVSLRWVKRTQDNAAKAVQEEKQKAAK